MDHLEKLGMDRCGRIIDQSSALLHPDNLRAVFDDYCEDLLDLDNSERYLNDEGIVAFSYFLRVYKTAFFWKKVRCEQKRISLSQKRRGLLSEKKHDGYQNVCDSMKEFEERCLQKVLQDLYSKI